MWLSDLLKELANVLLGELEPYVAGGIALQNESLVVLVLSEELVGDVTPDDLQERTVLD